MGGYPLLEVAQGFGAGHGHEGGLAAEGFQVGARVASGESRYLIQVEIGIRGHLAGVDPQYVPPRFGVCAAVPPAWLSGYAAVVAAAGDLLRRSPVRRTLDALTGTALVALGLRVAAQQRP